MLSGKARQWSDLHQRHGEQHSFLWGISAVVDRLFMSSRAQEDYAAVLPAVLMTMELPAELDVLFLIGSLLSRLAFVF